MGGGLGEGRCREPLEQVAPGRAPLLGLIRVRGVGLGGVDASWDRAVGGYQAHRGVLGDSEEVGGRGRGVRGTTCASLDDTVRPGARDGGPHGAAPGGGGGTGDGRRGRPGSPPHPCRASAGTGTGTDSHANTRAHGAHRVGHQQPLSLQSGDGGLAAPRGGRGGGGGAPVGDPRGGGHRMGPGRGRHQGLQRLHPHGPGPRGGVQTGALGG